jgi:glycosyltransferase involved in cell wall biosynthesis
MPPVEAMASGAPLVVSNRASQSGVVGSAGVLVDPNHIESVALTLESLIDDIRASMR